MDFIATLLHAEKKILKKLESVFLLFVRVYWGYAFFQAGYGKIFVKGLGPIGDWFATLKLFGQVPLPAPHLGAALAAGTEMVGGVLLMVGLGSRLVTIPMAFSMLVAYSTAHWAAISVIPAGEPFHVVLGQLVEQPPASFLLAALTVLFLGGGTFSLDALLARLVRGKPVEAAA